MPAVCSLHQLLGVGSGVQQHPSQLPDVPDRPSDVHPVCTAASSCPSAATLSAAARTAAALASRQGGSASAASPTSSAVASPAGFAPSALAAANSSRATAGAFGAAAVRPQLPILLQ